MEMKSSSTVVFLLISFLSSSLPIPSKALGSNCTTTATCSALIDYVSHNTTTVGKIANLFGISYMSLFGANSFPPSTSPIQTVEVNQTVKIPFQCSCGSGIGISNKVPVYTVNEGEYLIYIANKYSGLVTYQDIAKVNDIPNPNLIFIGQKLWIPLPCSCDRVEGDQVVHYGHVVSNESSVGQIANEYGTTTDTLLKLNGMAHPTELRAGQLIDVPLRDLSGYCYYEVIRQTSKEHCEVCDEDEEQFHCSISPHFVPLLFPTNPFKSPWLQLHHHCNMFISDRLCLSQHVHIAKVNDIPNPDLIFIGQKLWIPLPCSCDRVEGDQVLHYGHVVSNESSVGQIAKEYGTNTDTLLKLNGMAHPTELRAGQLIDVPLRACKSMVGNDSLDYMLLVPNGTKVLTANNCVQCTCDSSKNWTLHCEPSQGARPSSNWTECPPMQCQSGLLLGNSMSCTTCAYAGYTNRTILTTVANTCGGTDYGVARNGNSTDLRRKFSIAFSSAAGIGILVTAIVLYYCLKGQFPLNNKSKDIDVESFLKNNGSLVPKRYSYSDIKKMSNSFKDKLGEGGYGSVFKGNLLDGRLVAVKLLSKPKGNGEEFINEVASISRTSHVNVVALLGYCFEGIRRALVYEFMPNGSLDKFIYDEESSTTHTRLEWDTLFNITTGIARGLEYLHRGCNTRILHFDIKPHNILLDQDFCPKISDFGLAKLCPRKESVISMGGTRGTVGYIAPEVFFRNFGGVSHKSDVYSYGMMVLEIVGGRKNMKVSADHTSEIYFPHWIYRHCQQDQDLRLEGLTTTVEGEIARKMTIVGLWCIQTDPSDRPSMSKAVEMLEGSITSLQIPPKPYLCSSPRLPSCSHNNLENSLTS